MRPTVMLRVASDGDGDVARSGDVAVLRPARCGPGRRGGLAVVTDGATVGFDGPRWARLVASALAARGRWWSPVAYRRAIESARQHWTAEPPALLSHYHEEAWRRGAGTTVAATVVDWSHRCRRIRALTVGDSIVAVVRRGAVVETWPDLTAGGFGLRPQLVCTTGPIPAPVIGVRRLAPDDQVFVLTDALADWALGNPDAWHRLGEIAPGEFGKLVDELRASRRIEDDDTLLVRIA